MSAFDDIANLVPLQIWDGVVARVWSGDQAAMSAIELEPGVRVPQHQHPNEQHGILLRGAMTFQVGDETREIEPGATWVIPSNVPHQVQAGPEGAFLVELFAPPRSDWGDLPRLAPGRPARFPLG